MKPKKSNEDKYVWPNYTFAYGKCYYQGAYFGDVIAETADIIQVERKDGNRYCNGEIINFHINKSKQ